MTGRTDRQTDRDYGRWHLKQGLAQRDATPNARILAVLDLSCVHDKRRLDGERALDLCKGLPQNTNYVPTLGTQKHGFPAHSQWQKM